MSSTQKHVLQIYFKMYYDGHDVVCDDDFDNLKTIKLRECTFCMGGIVKNAMELFPIKQFKAVVFMFFNHPFMMQDARKQCQEYCKANGYFCYFINQMERMSNAALFHVKPNVSKDEKVIVCTISRCYLEFQIFIRNESHFRMEFATKSFEINSRTSKKSFGEILNLVTKIQPKKVIIIMVNPADAPHGKAEKALAIQTKNVLINFNSIICDKAFYHLSYSTSYAMVLDAMEEKKSPYLADPILFHHFSIVLNNSTNEAIIKREEWISLPFEASALLKVQSKMARITLLTEDGEIVETIKLKRHYKKEVKVVIKIDKNKFYQLFLEPVKAVETINEINETAQPSVETIEAENLAKTFDKVLTLSQPIKAKFILSETDLSLFVIENGIEKIVEGCEKMPLFIGFNDKKPNIGEEAQKLYKENPAFVIYDLIKLCSIMDPKEANQKWLFTVKMDENQEILVEFETGEGKKAASPAFLMALVFRDCLSKIKKQFGLKVTNFDIEFFDFKPKPELISTLKSAAKLVNITLIFG